MFSSVLVRKIGDLQAAVIEALDFLGYDFSGKRIWIKPNLLAPHPPEAGVTTSPELVYELVSELKRRNAKRIIVGDNPAGARRNRIEDYLKPTGVIEASQSCFQNVSINPVQLPLSSRYTTEIPVSSLIHEVDIILNLPVFKTHALTLLTGAIKNIFGIIPGGHKAYLHTLAASSEQFAELLIDIYQAVPVKMFHIMDGIRVMDGINGPSGGRVRKMDLLLASENGVALDAVMAMLAGVRPDSIPTVRIAASRGLGPADRTAIQIHGDFAPIPGFRLPGAGFASLITRLSRPVYRLIIPRVPVLNRNRCIRCAECARNCPVGAIEMNSFPEIDRRRCIRCFCCSEICPVKAMTIAGHLHSLWLRMRK
ncbi:MAG: DUF362 domain-containing protein [candidate division WOR-3 bacterium]|uniref:DUF362 domain-containing protein n=1 Tax=candidate division WOR-3 bacterium TaxID=2052148 RepID=A0A7C3J1M6_UNCW3|nr:DUF362 domain-containing protein [candidate division WOR-3 bacterium]